MFNIFRKKTQKTVSIFNIFLILLQQFAPLLFLPISAFAFSQPTVIEVTLGFNSGTNELILSGQANEPVDYVLTYSSSDSTDSIDQAIAGHLELSNGQFEENLYAGTCSAEECVPDRFDHGTLNFEEANFKANFEIVNGVLWLFHNDVATVSQVVKGVKYSVPQNEGMSVIFTKLPDKPGSLSIKKVVLDDDQAKNLGAIDKVAYDITSSMDNGSFEYDLILPLPSGSKNDLQVAYAQSLDKLDEANNTEVEIKGSGVVAAGLDHFTVFVVVDPNLAGNGNACTVVGIAGTCYGALQDAIDVAGNGDVIEIASDLSVTQEVVVGNSLDSLVIDGNGHTITSPFVKTDNSNNAAFGVYGDNITIKDLVFDGSGGTNLHGVNAYVATNLLLDGVTVNNFDRSGVVVNSSSVTVNNISTAGNGWNGINVDQTSGNPPASLTVNGYSSHADAAHIFVDDTTESVNVVDTLSQYSIVDSFNMRWYVLQDIIPPATPSLVEPANNAVVKGDVLLSDWTSVSDAHHYIYESYHNATASNLRWHGEYSSSEKTATNVANATFWWRVKAVDAAGNESDWSQLWKVTIDNNSPTIVLDSPTQSSFQRGNIDLQATCNEECDYINFWWRAADESYSNSAPDRRYHFRYDNGTVFNWTLDSLNAERWGGDPSYVMTDGDYYFYATGKDVAGNWARTTGERKITIDNTKPALAITTPANDDAIAGSFAITGTVSDDGAGVKDVRVRFRKEADNSLIATFWATYDSVTDTWSLNMNDGINTIPDGIYKIVVRARDELNQVRFRSVRRVAVDNTAPSVVVNSIKYDSGFEESTKFVTNYSQPLVLGTATDNNEVSTVTLAVNGQTYSATLTAGSWEAKVSTIIPDGLYDLVATVTDTAGNTATHTQPIRIDTQAPTAIYKQFDGAVEVTGTKAYVNDLARLSFTGEYTDNDPSANLYWDSYVIFEAQDDGSFRFSQNDKQAFCSWRRSPNLVDISGGSTFSLATPEAFTNCKTSLPDGEYYMAHQVYDAATRKDIPSINQFRDVLGLNFVIDTVIPTVAATVDPLLPNGNNDWYRSVPSISLTASDDRLLDRIEYRWDDGDWNVYAAPIESPSGVYTLYYRSFDAAGNVSTEDSLTTKFDQVAPDPGPKNLRITSLSLPTATLEWDAASDDNSGVKSYDISWKSKTNGLLTFGGSVGADVTTFDLHSLENGEWEIRVKAIDEAGNWTETLLLYVIGGETGTTVGEETTTTSSTGDVLGTSTQATPIGGGAVLGTATADGVAQDTTKDEVQKTQGKVEDRIDSNGEVLGSTSSDCNALQSNLPLILLFLQAILVVGFELINQKTGLMKVLAVVVLAGLAVVALKFFGDESCFVDGSISGFIANWFMAFSLANGFFTKAIISTFID